jgi:DNA-binding LytR/AlgR family response regulator
MKVSIEEINKEQEEEVIIRCYEVNEDILKIIHRIKNNESVLIGYAGDSIHRIKFNCVYYIETVDNKVFIYCKDKVFESKQKLYELEELCQGKKFLRTSKSIIINVMKITSLKPSLSGRFEACLDNGETVVISRQYVSVLKKMLGL